MKFLHPEAGEIELAPQDEHDLKALANLGITPVPEAKKPAKKAVKADE